MKNAILLTLAGVFLISLFTIGVTYAMPIDAGENSSSEQSVSEVPVEANYLLREYDGKLAVFTEDLVTPDLVFEVYVRTLPESDQALLQRGIRAASFDELTRLVEDYIS